MPAKSQFIRRNPDLTYDIVDEGDVERLTFADVDLEQGRLASGDYEYIRDSVSESEVYKLLVGTRKQVVLESKAGPDVETNPIIFYATCTKPMNGLEVSDIVVTNGTVSNLIKETEFRYIIEVTPKVSGNVNVNIGVDVLHGGNIGDSITVFFQNISYILKHRILVNFHQNSPAPGNWNNWTSMTVGAQQTLIDDQGVNTGITLALREVAPSMSYFNDGATEGDELRYIAPALAQGIQGYGGRVGFELGNIENNYKLSLFRLGSTLNEDNNITEHDVQAIYTDNRKTHLVRLYGRNNTTRTVNTNDVYGSNGIVEFGFNGALDDDPDESPGAPDEAPAIPDAGIINLMEVLVYETDDKQGGVGEGYPSSFALDKNSIVESDEFPRLVGRFSSNGTPTTSYNLVVGDLSNNLFYIQGSELWINTPTDSEINDSFDIRVDASTPGGVNRKTFTIQVTDPAAGNNPPASNFNFTKNGLTVSFTGAATDPDDDALTFFWDFGDGNTSTNVSPQHTYLEQGTYTVTLTVNDGLASDTYSTQINTGGQDVIKTLRYGALPNIPASSADILALTDYGDAYPASASTPMGRNSGERFMWAVDERVILSSVEQSDFPGEQLSNFNGTDGGGIILLSGYRIYYGDQGGAAPEIPFLVETQLQ